MLAAASLHRGSANRIACVKGKRARERVRKESARARTYRSHSGIVSVPDVDCDTEVYAKMLAIAPRFRNFTDPSAPPLSLARARARILILTQMRTKQNAV